MQNVFLSDKSYLAIVKQTAQFAPAKPSVFVPVIDADIKTDPKNTKVKQIVGINWQVSKVLQGLREHAGSITIQCDPDTIGHFMNIMGLKGSTTGDATVGYTHPFDVQSDGKYYTFELLKGNAVARFVDVKISKIEFSFADGYLIAKIDIVAGSTFVAGGFAAATSGAITTIALDTTYDQAPCDALVAGDVMQVWIAGVATDLTVLTISADKKSFTFASTSVTAPIGTLVTLKAQTVTQPTILNPFKFGRVLIGFGVDMASAVTAAGSYATATPLDDLKIGFDKGVNVLPLTGNEDPIVLPGIPSADVQIKRLFADAAESQKFLGLSKACAAIVFTGQEVTAGYPTTLTFKFYDLRTTKLENKIKAGEYLYDESTYEVVYSNADGKAADIILVNKSAGTVY